MQFQIVHHTTYTYSRPVVLHPHTVRLRPRSDGGQALQNFILESTPQPEGKTDVLDLEGNTLIQLWFAEEPVTALEIRVSSQTMTSRTNPFDFLLEPWATKLPIDYPASMAMHLRPYLKGADVSQSSVDPEVSQLAYELHQATEANPLCFLSELNQTIYQTCKHTYRETGDPLPAGITWKQKAGSCRDLAILFIEACRTVGLAARFVSGYQQGDPDSTDRHLHAWAEAYLPGGGWRGYDPTHGLAVADGHVALVASSLPKYAAPISGTFRGNAQAQIDYSLCIQVS